MADLTFTVIEEGARSALKISRDEYAICNYVQTWSAHPKNRRPGFCDRTKGQISAFIGISPRGIMKMLDKMERVGLIERLSETLFVHRITQHWFDVVTLANRNRKGEQSSSLESDQKENKVPLKGEQSSSLGENKVPPHKEYNKDLLRKEESADFLIKSTTEFPNVTLAELHTLEAKKEKTPQVARPPKKEKTAQSTPQPHEENRNLFATFDSAEKMEVVWRKWITEKWGQHRCKFKTAESEKIAINQLFKMSKGNAETAEAIIDQSIASTWKGLFDLKTQNNNNATTKPGTQSQSPASVTIGAKQNQTRY